MGREIKRVALDFDWPVGKIWPGYMGSFCGNMEYIAGKDSVLDEMCRLCNHFRKIIGEDYNMNKTLNCLNYENEPPEGDGYQLWCTTTEGHPMSPVFATPEELAHWLEDNKVSKFASETANYETWLAFIRDPGWAPSIVLGLNGLESGVDYVSRKANKCSK